MTEPKVTYDLRVVRFDSLAIAAETNQLMAEEDIDDMTGYAATTEDAGAKLTNAGGGGTTGLVAIAARLLHPRNIVITQVYGAITAGNVRVCGIGMSGLPTSELFALGTSTATLTGNVPFVRVNEVHVWGVTGSITTTDTFGIGTGAKLGLPMGSDCTLVDVIKEKHNFVDYAVTPANINRTYGTYTPTEAPGADHEIEIWYTVKRTLTW